MKGRLKRLENKIISLLGFASKAGKLSFGFDAAVFSAKSGKARLIAVSEEISPKSKKEMQFYSDKYNIGFTVLVGMDIEAVSAAVGKKCGIISVNDQGFADAILGRCVGGNANDK